jgi:monomeric isocitrate dehydrogenase
VTTHPTRVANFKPKELAKRVAFLRYDALAEFLGELSFLLFEDAQTDRERGRLNLAESLDEAQRELTYAKLAIDRAWTICEPKMKGQK